MAETPFIRVTKVGVVTVVDPGPTDVIQLQQGLGLAVINFPTPFVRMSLTRALPVVRRPANIQVTQARALVVAKGRTTSPYVRAWTFTMDGHDFYVLQLHTETLVYDFAAQRWYVWGSAEAPLWRGWTGRQWVASLPAALSYGSNVLVADDTFSTLYFLAPEQPTDDAADFDNEEQQTFKRVVTGQIMLRGADFVSCDGVTLTGSPPQLYDPSIATVELTTSDDAGNSYDSHGELTILEDDYTARLDWLSLGSMKSPGRLFRFTDYGAVTRIDSIDTPDGGNAKS